jgi:hypothetical protein
MGPISDVGAIAHDPHVRRSIRSKGTIMFSSFSALAGLDYQIRKNITEMVSLYIFVYKWNVNVLTMPDIRKFQLECKSHEHLGIL